MTASSLVTRPSQLIALGTPRARWTAVLAIALVALLPFAVNGYVLGLLTTCLIASIGAIGLNMLTGTTGLVSLGQSGFLLVGAYATSIAIADFALPIPVALFLGCLVSGLMSLIVGIPSLRLRELYLAITTLAFALIAEHLILYADDLTHGTSGIFLADLHFGPLDLGHDKELFWFVLGLTVLAILVSLNLLRSHVGRAWMAVRDHGVAAQVMGIELARWKLMSFFVSSLFVGLAGGLMALQVRFVNTEIFGVILSIEAITMIIIGGIGSIAGAVIGAFFVTLLPDVVAALSGSAGGGLGGNVYKLRGIAYGVVIIVFLRTAPGGLVSLWHRAVSYWRI
ncbi:branched-chain amino acid ABC transporter permease [Marinibacterium sp. SX1]|uniref:branched-chain amino acid ABC transporter permease n=1 Tax=Marinibacterium sp. SX1 TaxID=3388424 RepID=UPI003D16AD6F